MQKEKIPKYMFLHEESKEIQDSRIKSKNSQNSQIKKLHKKINNTICFRDKIISDNQINQLVYSNILNLLIVCINEQVLIIKRSDLKATINNPNKTLTSLKQISTQSIKFKGKVYLSPSQKKILLVSEVQLIFYDLENLKIFSSINNQFKLRHFIFIEQSLFIFNVSIVGWNFLSKAYYYKSTRYIKQIRQIQSVQNCTTVSKIKNHIFIFEKINSGLDNQNTIIYVWKDNFSQLINYIDLNQFQHTDSNIFNFSHVISFFSMKNIQINNFSSQDTYGLVVANYDDYQEQPDRRYLMFLKGNLLTKNPKLQIRGNELLILQNQQRSLYYNQEGSKLPFEVQIVYDGDMILFMIQKHSTVFVIDSTLQFSNLCIETINPKYQIKLKQKFIKGIALMKKPFDNQLNMKLLFQNHQQQTITQSPPSIIVLEDNQILRRYIINEKKNITNLFGNKSLFTSNQTNLFGNIQNKVVEPFNQKDLLEKNLNQAVKPSPALNSSIILKKDNSIVNNPFHIDLKNDKKSKNPINDNDNKSKQQIRSKYLQCQNFSKSQSFNLKNLNQSNDPLNILLNPSTKKTENFLSKVPNPNHSSSFFSNQQKRNQTNVKETQLFKKQTINDETKKINQINGFFNGNFKGLLASGQFDGTLFKKQSQEKLFEGKFTGMIFDGNYQKTNINEQIKQQSSPQIKKIPLLNNSSLKKQLQKQSQLQIKNQQFLFVPEPDFKAAELGNSNQQYNLGKSYQNGLWGVKQNTQKAKQWFTKAALKGHQLAQFRLSLLKQKK